MAASMRWGVAIAVAVCLLAAGAEAKKPKADCKNDPHFTGARGTKFDFNGEPNMTYCLITDANLHINIKLSGYLGTDTKGATVLKNGKAIRTWIREIGMLWRENGAEHTLHLVARKSTQTERGEGFLSSISIDGQKVAVPGMKEVVNAPGGLHFVMVNQTKKGIFDLDQYKLTIAGLLDIDLGMRVAQPALQSPDDAEAHFNIHMESLNESPLVHGLLGQTYRADHQSRAAKFSLRAAQQHSPVVADGESGAGFLDGKAADYLASQVLAPDCKFASFAKGAALASS